MRGKNLKQGYYRLRNPAKYVGDPTNVFYRSGWELRVMKYLDENTNVLRWSTDGLGRDCSPSERSGLAIPYISPIDNRPHRYFPDFWAEIRSSSGETKTYLMEVKPQSQTQPPKQGKNQRRFISEVMTYGVNVEKWRAATQFCKNRGWEFRIITEAELGLRTK